MGNESNAPLNTINDEEIGVSKNIYVSIPFRNIRTANSHRQICFDHHEKILHGFIYVLENESMPNIYKIGMTKNNPDARAKELSSSTGVPTPFKVVKYFHVKDTATAESEIHKYLAEYRVNNKREFFKCSIEKIDEALSETSDFINALNDEDVFYSRPVVSIGAVSKQRRSILVSNECYERLEMESCDSVNQLAENLIRFVLENISCGLSFIDGQPVAFPSAEYGEYASEGLLVPDHNTPSIIAHKPYAWKKL